MKPLPRLVLLPLSLLVLLIVAGRADAQATHCKRVHARIESKVVEAGTAACPIACTAGEVTGNGLLTGTTRFTASALVPAAGLAGENPATTFSDSGTFVLTTRHGSLTSSSIGLLDLAAGVFFDIGRITGGTGRFHDATGIIFFSGAAVLSGPTILDLAFAGDISAEVCLADD
jgi:hypothetical protein